MKKFLLPLFWSSTLLGSLRTTEAAGESLPWVEMFDGQPNGSQSDSGPTSWTAKRSSGIFEVQDGALVVNEGGTQAVLKTGSMDISAPTAVEVSLNLYTIATGDGMESSDYVQLYAVLDGGTEELIGGVVDEHPAPGTSIAGSIDTTAATTLQLVIRSKVSYFDEWYYITKLSVIALGSTAAPDPPNELPTAKPVVSPTTAPVVVLEALPWVETFENQLNGSQRDSGPTSWIATRSSGIFEVQDGALVVNEGGTQAVLKTGSIDISAPTTVEVSLNLHTIATGDGMESSDYVQLYAVLDGGTEELIGGVVDEHPAPGTSIAGSIDTTAATTLQLVIRSKVSYFDEWYYITKLSVIALGSTAAPVVSPTAMPVGVFSCDAGADGSLEILLPATKYDDQSGVYVVSVDSSTEIFTDAVGFINHGDWIMFQNVEFSSCASQVQIRVAGNWDGGYVEIRLGSLVGDMLGKCLVIPTGGFDAWETRYCTITPVVQGTHDVYLVFLKYSADHDYFLFNLEWIKFLSDPLRTTGNPIITHIRTADPSARIWDDGKIWIYASHDMDDATDYNSMDGYHVFSSLNLKDWTDHGEVLHSRDVSWGIAGGGYMWAPDAGYKNGIYYFYFPHKDKTGDWRIGVATSHQPQGPFSDIGNYIEGTTGIDPCVFIDDDGQAYLYFGHRNVAKLMDNMIELAEPSRQIDIGSESGFSEGAWMHKRNGLYYFSYTWLEGPDGQSYYGVGDSPYGPFEFQGPLATQPAAAQDHHSIVEYKGTWYYFYHVGGPGPNPWHRRMVAVDYADYNSDGTMKLTTLTSKGVEIV